MPKKAATARNSVQRNKAKAQKSFEVVRQNAEGQELNEDEQLAEVTPIDAPTPLAEVRPTKSARRAATRASVATQEVETETETAASETETDAELAPIATIATTIPAKGSASARMAARRGQKLQQRTPATLVTSEHYAYVTRDLMIIAVLAMIMFIAIIVLYFTIGRGA
jgi:cobalamin biosynthesis Mg chelatase CobN